ncbi:MAG TPA: OsmC family protein [Cytophagaceae bacterium]|jgi:osmotically inducible protein OsmC|nr:OsmC family protein [Cytophagaceae bacterium]
MPIRTANATWNGDLKTGKGIVSSESGLFKDAAYNFAQRFENAKGTNPEELLGAAHAACFSMALSAGLSGAGFTVKSVKTTDKVHIDKVGDGFTITKIEVTCDAEVVGIDDKKFQEIAENTKKGCPVSKALTGVEFILKATLKK